MNANSRTLLSARRDLEQEPLDREVAWKDGKDEELEDPWARCDTGVLAESISIHAPTHARGFLSYHGAEEGSPSWLVKRRTVKRLRPPRAVPSHHMLNTMHKLMTGTNVNETCPSNEGIEERNKRMPICSGNRWGKRQKSSSETSQFAGWTFKKHMT